MSKARPAPPTVAFIDDYRRLLRAVSRPVRDLFATCAGTCGMLSSSLPCIWASWPRHVARPGRGWARLSTPMRRPCITFWPMPNGRWKRCGRDGWSCCARRLARPPSSFSILCIDETGDRKKGHTTDDVASQVHRQPAGAGQGERRGHCVRRAGRHHVRSCSCASSHPRPASKRALGTRPSRTWPLRSARRRCARAGASASSWPLVSPATAAPSSARYTAWACGRWWPSTRITASGCCRASASGASGASAGGPSSASSPLGPATSAAFARPSSARAGPCAPSRSPPTRATLPPETTWDLMTNQPGKSEDTVGNTVGLRTWIEYGFKQAKDDLGWADDRVTEYDAIARWWELVRSASTWVRLQTADVAALAHLAPPPDASSTAPQPSLPGAVGPLETHPAWDMRTGWKHHLNTWRRLLQPYVCS